MRAFAVIIFLVAQVGAANSETFYTELNGRTVNVFVPDEYCVLTGEDESENMLLEYLNAASEGTNTVLIAFADCGQLGEWKQGARVGIDKFGYMASPLAPSLAEIPVEQDEFNLVIDQKLSQQFDAEIGQALADGKERAQSILDDMGTGAQMGETTSLGYFGYDLYGSYGGLVQNLSTPQEQSKSLIGLYSSIVVQNRLIYFYIFDRYSADAEQVSYMLELIQLYSQNQHEVN